MDIERGARRWGTDAALSFLPLPLLLGYWILDIGYWILDVGCWILKLFAALGSARFQRASLRVPRQEPEPHGARPRDLTARRRDATATVCRGTRQPRFGALLSECIRHQGRKSKIRNPKFEIQNSKLNISSSSPSWTSCSSWFKSLNSARSPAAGRHRHGLPRDASATFWSVPG